MKTIFTLLMLMMIGMSNVHAQTYLITTNKTWSSAIGGSCYNCTITVSPGVTFTLNSNVTCGTCTITGGKLLVSNSFTCQTCTISNDSITVSNQAINLQSGVNTFTNVVLNASGTASVTLTAGIALNSSIFTFNNKSFLNGNGGTLTFTSSNLFFYDTAYFTTTSGPVKLNTGSHLIAGSGSVSSKAYIYFNGPALTLVDANSSVSMANYNNYYFNWSAYTSQSNSATYSTASNSFNCGGSKNACAAPYMYGCATLTSTGAASCASLPVSITDFSAYANGSNTVDLSWTAGDLSGDEHFILERSSDGVNWNAFTTIEANAYSGQYRYTDNNPFAGTGLYRIKMIHADGNSGYSKIITVRLEDAASHTVSLFPNPATGNKFNLKFNETTTALINVFSIEGKLIFTNSLSGQTQYAVNIPASASNSGYLIVQVITKEKTTSFNLLHTR